MTLDELNAWAAANAVPGDTEIAVMTTVNGNESVQCPGGCEATHEYPGFIALHVAAPDGFAYVEIVRER